MAAIDRVTTQGGSRNAALRETNQTAIIVRLLRKAQVMGVRDAICGENLHVATRCAADAAEGVLLFTPLGEKLGNFGIY